MTMALPSAVVLDTSDYVSIELDTDQPYRYYDEHRGTYRGHGHFKKHGHGNGHSTRFVKLQASCRGQCVLSESYQ